MDEKTENELPELAAELISDITAAREQAGMSQSKLAELAGIKQSALSRMESLSAVPRLDLLVKILAPLNMRLTIKKIDKESLKMEVTNTNILQLTLDTLYCNMTLAPSADTNFHIVAEDEKEFTITSEDNVLHIKQKKRKPLKWLYDWKPQSLMVQVPQTFEGKINIDSNNGKILIASVSARDITVRGSNGSIKCENLTCNELAVNSSNGRIYLKKISALNIKATNNNGKVEAEALEAQNLLKLFTSNGRVIVKNCIAAILGTRSSNGLIDIENCQSPNITAVTSNGRIFADLEDNEDNYRLDLSTNIGRIFVGDKKFRGGYVSRGGEKSFEAKTSNGALFISFKDHKVPSSETEAEIPEDEDIDILPKDIIET